MPGSGGDPGEISSSPVEMMATLGRLMVSTESLPSEAATPISAARMTVPRFRTNSPASMSSPAGRTLSPASAPVLTEIWSRTLPSRLRSDSSVSSNGTTASALSGMGAPVIIRIAPPGGTGAVGQLARGYCAGDGQQDGLRVGGGRDVCRAYGVSVHGRICQRGYVEGRCEVLIEHAAPRFEQGRVDGVQP